MVDLIFSLLILLLLWLTLLACLTGWFRLIATVVFDVRNLGHGENDDQ